MPASLVEYVIVHELAYLSEANHTHRFWRLVERALPDFEFRKEALAGEEPHWSCSTNRGPALEPRELVEEVPKRR